MEIPARAENTEKPQLDGSVLQTHSKKSSNGIVLVPQPSDDPLDPLNWSQQKKLLTLSIVSAAAFAGYAQNVANQSGYFQQAEAYGTTAGRLSYSVGKTCIRTDIHQSYSV